MTPDQFPQLAVWGGLNLFAIVIWFKAYRRI